MLVKNLSNLLGTRVRLTAVTVNDCVLKRQTTFTYLGNVFNEKLSWAEHHGIIVSELLRHCLRDSIIKVLIKSLQVL